MPKTLVIVESPTKAKTISKFLGSEFLVESSLGHIRDLPKSKMGVNTEDGSFEPQYVIPRDKSKHVKKLKELAIKSKGVIFATDEDREGEAISWHLAEVLDIPLKEAKRIVFHEITKHAIQEALKEPRSINQPLVDAQQARRVLDRLVGYELSPLLWKKIARGLSAGRVQSVALRLIVEREREIRAFKSEEFWSLEGIFAPLSLSGTSAKEEEKFTAALYSVKEKKLDKLGLRREEEVQNIISDLENCAYHVGEIEKKETKRNPPPPFRTSTLQQQANQKFGFSSKQTMRLAQQLYEGIELGSEGHVGLITYMRTDSTNLSSKFLNEASQYIQKTYGASYSLESPRFYKSTAKGAQEAHEAIRPSEPERSPESIRAHLEPNQFKLYSLIWKRALATQMSEARLNKTSVDVKAKQYLFKAHGQTMIFDGWLALYPEAIKEELLPELTQGEELRCLDLKKEQHFTQPPARYSDATLVKILEEYGIGRPSTYAPTISTIEARNYVERDENKRLKPLDIAEVVNDMLVEHFPNIVDYHFTAQMEENLDAIAEGTKQWRPVLSDFYKPFHEHIVEKTKSLSKEDMLQARELGQDPVTGKPIYARIGRFGPFVQKGSKEDEEKPTFASLPKGVSLQTVTLEEALKFLSLPKILGQDSEGNDLTVGIGRFGPYIKCQSSFYSIKNADPYHINLENALELIREKREEETKKIIAVFKEENIQILNGRYGPYVTDGLKNARIPKDTDPLSLGLDDCKKMLSTAKEKRGRRKKIKTS
ncbi:MAG: type I DNA topoisomerase [Candidatus Magasanikbacteria bacterium]|nr:type I DNA topoisomerase [Candidatus Magasanikbacteria bacterium]